MRAKTDGDLARVKYALVATEEARTIVEESKRKAESKASRLKVDRMSLLLELGTAKDEVSSLQSQIGKDNEAMEEEYHKAMEVIFSYGYGCCVFKHNIYGDYPKVPQGMPDSTDPLPPKFFVNPSCAPIQAATEATTTEVPLNEATKKLVEIVATEDHGRLYSLFFRSYLITIFL